MSANIFEDLRLEKDDDFHVSTLEATNIALVECILDVSQSMERPFSDDCATRRIDLLNQAVHEGLIETLKHPPVGVTPLLGLVVVGGDVTSYSPVPISGIELPDLKTPRGLTPLGMALDAANDAVEESIAELSKDGLPFKAPTIAVFTDGLSRGEGEDALPKAVKRTKALAAATNLQLVGLTLNQEDANLLRAAGIDNVRVISKRADWTEVFRWVSMGSMRGFANVTQAPYLA